MSALPFALIVGTWAIAAALAPIVGRVTNYHPAGLALVLSIGVSGPVVAVCL